MNKSYVKTLVDARNVSQKTRVAFGNRIGAVETGDDTMTDKELKKIKDWYDLFLAVEEEVSEQILEAIEGVEIIERLVDIKGIGEMLAAQVTCMVDIRRAPTVSSLWKYCGMGVTDGERDKKVKNVPLSYNQGLKTICHKIATQFMMNNSPYRQEYDIAKEYYEINRPDWTKGHKDFAAKRKMIKLFLSHLWETWRKIEGLPTTAPYSHDKLGHTHLKTPQEYGWRDL